MGALDTHIPRLPLTTSNKNYTNVGYWNEPLFFLPTLDRTWHEGMPSFLHWGGGDEDVIVMMGGTQTPEMPRTMANMRAVPTRNNQCQTTL